MNTDCAQGDKRFNALDEITSVKAALRFRLPG